MNRNNCNMKKIGVPILCMLLIAVFVCPHPTFAAEPPTPERIAAAYLYNFENDLVLYESGTDLKLYPASTVKLMTGILAIEALGNDPNRLITVTKDMLNGVLGNNIGLDEGEVVTVESMLYALLAGGSNDAAQVLAVTIAGSVEAFVEKMNEKAIALGAVDTYYKNPSGMHNEGMVTTLLDTVKIAKYAYTLPLFMEITSTPKYVMAETNLNDYRNIYNRNALISKNAETQYYMKEAAGLNAGSTKEAGYCLVTTASQENLTYLCIVMGAEKDEETELIYSYVAAKSLIQFAFDNYAYVEVLSSKDLICEVPVNLSQAVDYVTLVPAQSLEVYIPTDTDLAAEVTYSYKTIADELDAPVEVGQVAGMITVIYKDEIIGNIDLVTTSAVTRSEFLYFMEQVKEFTGSVFFISTIIAAVVISIGYVLLNAILRHRREMRSRRYK